MGIIYICQNNEIFFSQIFAQMDLNFPSVIIIKCIIMSPFWVVQRKKTSAVQIIVFVPFRVLQKSKQHSKIVCFKTLSSQIEGIPF